MKKSWHLIFGRFTYHNGDYFYFHIPLFISLTFTSLQCGNADAIQSFLSADKKISIKKQELRIVLTVWIINTIIDSEYAVTKR